MKYMKLSAAVILALLIIVPIALAKDKDDKKGEPKFPFDGIKDLFIYLEKQIDAIKASYVLMTTYTAGQTAQDVKIATLDARIAALETSSSSSSGGTGGDSVTPPDTTGSSGTPPPDSDPAPVPS